MGTAVWHPQDCLAASHRDQHHRFSCVSEYPRPDGRRRAISATYEASIPVIEFGSDVAEGNTSPSQGGLLGRKNASAGLLPLPDQALQSAHSPFRRLAPKISPCRSGKIVDPRVSKNVSSSQHSNYASDVHISRCPSVPILDHAAHTQKFFPERYPVHAVQLHERKPPRYDAKRSLNSAQGSCMVGSSSPCAAGALSCQKLKLLANSHFSNVFNPVHPNWVDSTAQNIHCRKRMHPEFSQVEAYLGRQCAKPPFKVSTDGQGKTLGTNTSTVGRKDGVSKQLRRSASEKRQERLELPILLTPKTKEAAKKRAVGSHSTKCHSSLQKQVSLDAYTLGRMCVFKVGAARSSQMTLSSQMGGTKRNVGASSHGQYYGNANAAVEPKETNEGDQMTVTAGCVSENQYLRNIGVTSTFDNQLGVSNMKKPDTTTGLEEISRSLNPVLDSDEMWVSVMNDERWAGPSFFNSPSPSSLPVPSFKVKFSRTESTAVPTKTADYGAQTVSDNSLLKAKCMWDAAFATEDLRRMLNIAHATCDL